jgi:uncharacterized protein
MKLHADQLGAVNAINGYGPDYVQVRNGDIVGRFTTSVIISPKRVINPWVCTAVTQLTESSFDMLLAADDGATAEGAALDVRPEIVLLGTGRKLTFPNMRIFNALRRAQIGFEVMDTQAACRTYNILLAESRNVAAALIFGD